MVRRQVESAAKIFVWVSAAIFKLKLVKTYMIVLALLWGYTRVI